ncbi:MAG: HD-GYP domain-containing protein [Bradymonadales bacterium]|nr:MAG: HD-GYP domain-containing protein [Bradymonadales bacterium]
MIQAAFESLDQNIEKQYVPVELDFIELDSLCEQNIYLFVQDRFVLYRGANLPFTLQDKLRLEKAKQNKVYIYCENEADLRRFYESNLTNIIESDKVAPEKKAKVLYQCAKGIAKDLFEKPTSTETIQRSRGVVDNTLSLLSKSSDAFVQMISLSGHDYYTYTHCVNVLTLTVSLLSDLGYKDPRFLKEAGMGALLHDVGKKKVPIEILNKPGKLTEEEWQVMKRHPEFGAEIVERARMPERGVDIIIQHHERINGKGYPHGLVGQDIPIASQVVAITDAYDAMTTNRCYQKAMKPFDAMRIITQEMKGHYNPQVVQKFLQMLNVKNKLQKK